jgi:transmembrane 9 superfamily protein 2/4
MEPQHVDPEQEGLTEIVWTYDVKWEPSEIKWASRWDLYLLVTDDQIHWFSIINSLMIVIFLSGMVAMIMMRTLNHDIRTYNEASLEEEGREETGWKLVHGDVFRAPAWSNLLSVAVGTGSQLIACSLIVLVFACLGFLSPANRGSLLTAMLLLFVFMGIFAGYFGSRTYKMFKGVHWKSNTVLTATWFPSITFGIFFFINFFVWGEHSSGAVPFSTLLVLLFLWIGISTPLVFLGAYFGFKKKAIEFPVRIHQIPRMIPEQPWYMHPIISVAMGGLLPFGAVFIELFFILSSIWLHHYYYVFGFLLLVFLILAVTCSEICIVMTYFQLCSEDYHWWWRSFFTAGSSAFYMFGYSIFYFTTKLEITKFVSALLYFGYMWIISFAFFVLTGTMGFGACFMFCHYIYGAIKVD